MKNIVKICVIIIGNAVCAFGVAAFIIPSNLITGGSAGIGLFINNIFNIPVAATVAVFNIAMFILGLALLGKKFAATTLISTFWYPIVLSLYQKIPWVSEITDDKLLSVIFSGILIGTGIGMVIKGGASTGGLDIPPLVINKKWGFSISTSLYIFDTLILIAQMVSADKERILYGILLVLIYTTVLNKVLMMGNTKTQIKIISKKYEEINQVIISEIDRGSTLLKGETGYIKDNIMVVLTVVSNRQVPKLRNLVLEIDKEAFIIINNVNEVRGKGFSLKREY